MGRFKQRMIDAQQNCEERTIRALRIIGNVTDYTDLADLIRDTLHAARSLGYSPAAILRNAVIESTNEEMHTGEYPPEFSELLEVGDLLLTLSPSGGDIANDTERLQDTLNDLQDL